MLNRLHINDKIAITQSRVDRGSSASAEIATNTNSGWTSDMEIAFDRAIDIYDDVKSRNFVSSDGEVIYCGRNEAIARYVFEKTGVAKTSKQVASHIQARNKRQRRDFNAVNHDSRGSQEDFDYKQCEESHEKSAIFSIPSPQSHRDSLCSQLKASTLSVSQFENSHCYGVTAEYEALKASRVIQSPASSPASISNNKRKLSGDHSDLVIPPFKRPALPSPQKTTQPGFTLTPHCMFTVSPHHSGSVAHVSIPYSSGGEPTLLSAFQFPTQTTVDIVSTIVSFGQPIFRCGMAHESAFDDETENHIIVADCTPLDDFLQYFQRSLSEMGNTKTRKIVARNLLLYQTLLTRRTANSEEPQVPLLELVVALDLQ